MSQEVSCNLNRELNVASRNMKLLIQDQIHNFKKVFVVAIKKGLYYLVVRERDQGIMIVLHNRVKSFSKAQFRISATNDFAKYRISRVLLRRQILNVNYHVKCWSDKSQ